MVKKNFKGGVNAYNTWSTCMVLNVGQGHENCIYATVSSNQVKYYLFFALLPLTLNPPPSLCFKSFARNMTPLTGVNIFLEY